MQDDIEELKEQFILLSNSIKSTIESDSGSLSIGNMAANANTIRTIAFKKPFNNIPKITISGSGIGTSTPGNWSISCSVQTITQSGFNAAIINRHAETMTNVKISWVAQASISSLS